MKNFFFRGVSHNAESNFRIFKFEYCREFENKIKIILNYHSVVHRKGLMQKNGGQNSRDTVL